MAERRMFAKKITESDAFLDMPASTQNLYFHLNMSADDDGFVNSPKRVQRTIGASDDDFNLLVAKSFVLVFESGVIVIKHWKMHNYIQKDRYKPTDYLEEKEMLELKENKAYTLDANKMYTECIQDVRVGKVREVEVREVKTREEKVREAKSKKDTIDYQMIIDEYNNRCSKLPTLQKLTDKRKTSMRTFLKEYTFDEMLEVFDRANESEFLTSGTWSCNFDWIINKNNAAKILEGNYSNKKQPETKEERILNRVDEVDNWV